MFAERWIMTAFYDSLGLVNKTWRTGCFVTCSGEITLIFHQDVSLSDLDSDVGQGCRAELSVTADEPRCRSRLSSRAGRLESMKILKREMTAGSTWVYSRSIHTPNRGMEVWSLDRRIPVISAVDDSICFSGPAARRWLIEPTDWTAGRSKRPWTLL